MPHVGYEPYSHSGSPCVSLVPEEIQKEKVEPEWILRDGGTHDRGSTESPSQAVSVAQQSFPMVTQGTAPGGGTLSLLPKLLPVLWLPRLVVNTEEMGWEQGLSET